MDDPRAKGKQVELVIYHSLNEDVRLLKKLLGFCGEELKEFTKSANTIGLSLDEQDEYRGHFLEWPDTPRIVSPKSDSTGAGPDITIFCYNSKNKKVVIFISLKTSSSGRVQTPVCDSGVESLDYKSFWGKRGDKTNSQFSGLRTEIINKMEDPADPPLCYRIQISLPTCICWSQHEQDEKKNKKENLYYMDLDQLKQCVHNRTHRDLEEAFPK
eukprot:TRINITY_DN514_c0_g1_i2.p1 TRINITY_DN514_c0_g1~~TRINITY_DN514_c0_g1_i2.p1  ORF type:complete len:214 (+),score=32.13 TRINITY_DN514_c0_g1_i2:264-905(+)